MIQKSTYPITRKFFKEPVKLECIDKMWHGQVKTYIKTKSEVKGLLRVINYYM